MRLPHAGVAAPLYPGHLPGNDIGFEETVTRDSAFFVLQRNRVVTRFQRKTETALIISSEERRCSFFVLHDECRVC